MFENVKIELTKVLTKSRLLVIRAYLWVKTSCTSSTASRQHIARLCSSLSKNDYFRNSSRLCYSPKADSLHQALTDFRIVLTQDKTESNWRFKMFGPSSSCQRSRTVSGKGLIALAPANPGKHRIRPPLMASRLWLPTCSRCSKFLMIFSVSSYF